jgi:hypothetical protein
MAILMKRLRRSGWSFGAFVSYTRVILLKKAAASQLNVLASSCKMRGGAGCRNEFQKCNYGTKDVAKLNFIFPLASAPMTAPTNYFTGRAILQL